VRVWIYGRYAEPVVTGVLPPVDGTDGRPAGDVGASTRSSGLPHLQAPATLGGRPIVQASACDGAPGGTAYAVAEKNLAAKGGRFERPPGGFRCMDRNGGPRNRTVELVYPNPARPELVIRVNVYWQEAGDSASNEFGYRKFFCAPGHNWESLAPPTLPGGLDFGFGVLPGPSGQGGDARQDFGRTFVDSRAYMAVFASDGGSPGLRTELEQMVGFLFSQIAPYARQC
jgi:hypothetical protein